MIANTGPFLWQDFEPIEEEDSFCHEEPGECSDGMKGCVRDHIALRRIDNEHAEDCFCKICLFPPKKEEDLIVSNSTELEDKPKEVCEWCKEEDGTNPVCLPCRENRYKKTK